MPGRNLWPLPPIPSVTAFCRVGRGQGVLHTLCPVRPTGLSQGRQGAVPVVCLPPRLPDTPHPTAPLPELCHSAEEFLSPGTPPAGVLTAAVLYWCKSRARPADRHPDGGVFHRSSAWEAASVKAGAEFREDMAFCRVDTIAPWSNWQSYGTLPRHALLAQPGCGAP